jgi:hypothetical protein
MLVGLGGRKSCCSAGTWSGRVAGGVAVGLRKSNRSGMVSSADPPWKCATGALGIIGAALGSGCCRPIRASKLLDESTANGWAWALFRLKSIRALIS